MAEMTEELLRQVLQEAHEKQQIGLLIWHNWNIWNEIAYELKEGNEHYDFAVSQVTDGNEATITYELWGLKFPAVIVVSVQKMLFAKELFEEILKICKQNNYIGPVTLIPLNEVAECI